MENQDKIFEQFKDASKKVESKDFPAMDKVWARVEEKLDKKEDKKVIAIWKKIGIAASLLLFFSLGYQFLKTDKEIVPENPVVIEENLGKIAPENETVAESPKAEVQTETEITKRAIIKKETVSGDDDTENAIASSTTTKDAADAVAETEIKSVFNSKTAITETVEIEAKDLTTQNATIAASEIKVNPVTNEKTVTGTVTDSYGPIPGVNVIVKGTNRGTQTDFDGKYTIVANPGEKLEFSFIGMKPTVASVGDSNRMNIALKENSNTLEEVVVTGYQAKKKKNVTGSVAIVQAESDKTSAKLQKAKEASSKGWTINSNAKRTDESNDYNYYRGNIYMKNSDDLTKSTVTQSLQGKVSGVYTNDSSKQFGGNNKVVLRGTHSIDASHEPLYILNGIPVSGKEFALINPKYFDSVSVLKDATATSLYGSRGANGVILVTTKNISKRKIKKMLRQLEEENKTGDTETTKFIEKQPIEISQEDYDSFVENPFESPKNEPLSTFSIDVDNASYTNVRRFINNGQMVPKDAVRVEEMLNFFKYDYPQPKDTNPFSINTEYSDAPWNPKHKILKIGLQGKNIPTEKLPASNLVFLIDVSGSMNSTNKLPLLKQSMKILVEQLRKEDKVSIIVYAGAAGMVLPPTSGSDKTAIIEALEKLNAGGSTAGGAGIELAYKTAEENFIKNGNNRVILATDGDFNVGSSSNTDMQTLIEEKRKSGVFLTCLGYGMGNYKDSKMQILADKGNGNHAYIDNIQEANRFLGKEFKGSMFAIAKDVKIQIEFNPKHVQSYRLIGYESRKLRPEDFTNDAIDAGELGSGHTVTALYEVIPTGIESEFLNKTPDLKYSKTQENPNAYNEELATIKFRYKKPDGDTSIEMINVIEDKSIPLKEASNDFKFSAAVAWFGLKLRDSKLIPNKSSEDIKKLAKEGLSNDEEGYKAEFIRLVESVK